MSAPPLDGYAVRLPERVRVAVIGAGFSGLALAVRLRAEGLRGPADVAVLEQADGVGGTWRANTYPGATCDVPSNLYSFSFAPNPRWSRSFSPQPEILAYLRASVDRFGLRPVVHLGTEVLGADWEADGARWRVTTSRGTLHADVLVSAAGPLSAPALPDLPGLGTFEGPVFHSAAWDHDADLAGKRVAVVGTGASAIQFVPRLQREVARLHVFQRTPPWIVARGDRALSGFEHQLYGRVPGAQRAVRKALYLARELYVLGFTVDQRFMRPVQYLARRHLQRQVHDPELRARLTPSYTVGCKRILLSNDYYPAIAQPNVELVTDAIAKVGPGSVVTVDGTERPVDAIVCGTGFHVTPPPVAGLVRGAGGRSLADAWAGGMAAYKGTAIAGFPNLFLLLGPNSGFGHTSVLLVSEAQQRYAQDALRYLRRTGAAAVDVTPDAMAAWNDRVQRRMRTTVWLRGGCASWYLDERGRNTTLWPASTGTFTRALRRFDPEAYTVVGG